MNVVQHRLQPLAGKLTVVFLELFFGLSGLCNLVSSPLNCCKKVARSPKFYARHDA